MPLPLDVTRGTFPGIPGDLLTQVSKPGYRRVRVDVGQTGFFDGREFRTFREISLSGGTTLTIKAVIPINIILAGFTVDLISGSVRVVSAIGGTEGGTFSETLPVFPRNTMSERPTPLYVPQVVLTAGGTVSGFTTLDVFRVQTSGQGAQVGSVGSAEGDERGIGAGNYYILIEASGSDAAVGVVRVRWEERPVGT